MTDTKKLTDGDYVKRGVDGRYRPCDKDEPGVVAVIGPRLRGLMIPAVPPPVVYDEFSEMTPEQMKAILAWEPPSSAKFVMLQTKLPS